MNELPEDPVDISVIAVDQSAASAVKAVAQSLSFHPSEFSTVNEFLDAENATTTSCVVLCAGSHGDIAQDFQTQLSQRGPHCPSVILITDITVREAIKLMEQGAMTVLTSQFDRAELTKYLKSAVDKNRQRQKLQARVAELESCRGALSERQLKILNMVEQGHSNRQIANWFDLSQRTIELERARLMSAFQSASVAQLVSKWTELRVLTKLWHKTDEVDGASDRVIGA